MGSEFSPNFDAHNIITQISENLDTEYSDIDLNIMRRAFNLNTSKSDDIAQYIYVNYIGSPEIMSTATMERPNSYNLDKLPHELFINVIDRLSLLDTINLAQSHPKYKNVPTLKWNRMNDVERTKMSSVYDLYGELKEMDVKEALRTKDEDHELKEIIDMAFETDNPDHLRVLFSFGVPVDLGIYDEDTVDVDYDGEDITTDYYINNLLERSKQQNRPLMADFIEAHTL